MNGSINSAEQVGSTDNRLSLSLGDYPFAKDWEDGTTYTLSVTVEQQSPGEFNVVSAEPTSTEAEEPGEVEEEREEELPEGRNPSEGEMVGGRYANPAIAKMMRRGA